MSPLAVFSGPYALLAKWGVIVGFVGAFAAFFWIRGDMYGTQKLIDYQGKQATQAIKVITKIQVVKEMVRVPYAKREIQIERVFIPLEKEATNVPSRPSCNITAGWMFEHDTAAAGQSGGYNGTVDDSADTRITEAQAIGVVVTNYKFFHQVANDLSACRKFVEGVSAATK